MNRHRIIVAGSVLVDMLGYGLIMPLLPFMARAWSDDALVVGMLGSLYAAMQLLLAPMLGAVSDRIGRRPVLLLCLFGSALAYLGLALADSLWFLAAAIALGGAAGSSMPVAQAYIADVTTPAERARGLGLLGAAFGLGLIGGAAIGGALSQYGLAIPPLLAAAIALLNALYATIALPESLPVERRRPQPLRPHNLLAPALSALHMPAVRPLLIAVALLNVAFAGLQSNIALFTLTRFGWGPEQNAVLFVFVGLCAAFTQGVLLGRLQPQLGEARLASGGLGLMAAAFALVGLVAQSGWLLFAPAAMLAIGMGLAVPAITSLVSLRAGAGRQGAVLGGMQALISFALLIGPISFGLIFDSFGPDAPYLVSGALLAGAWAITTLALTRPILAGASRSFRPSEDPEAQV
ncbi:MFS transporter [Chloroflexus islandicus]|uniref:MFS transporter n=1 Tax=Chloroflexus islandicus TaxID=1707952 RepID=A0A178M1S8_9CHLR|nr:MFS transporter [Chloroflexus islandicus]OAN40587.1 MFS transporter [Chloroflexus islandicus]